MKKFFGFLVALVATLFITAVPLIAQDGTTVPPNWESYVITFAAYLSTILLVVELVMTFVKNMDYRKAVIWVVSLVLGILAFILKLGIFYELWYIGLLYVLAGGAVTIGYLTAAQGEMLVDLIKKLLASKKSTNK